MAFHINTIRDGLNLLFPVPVARVTWLRHKDFSVVMQGLMSGLDVGSVHGNRLKLEGSGDLTSINDPLVRDLYTFILDRAGDVCRSLLGAELAEAFGAMKRATRSAFRETDFGSGGGLAVADAVDSVDLKITRSWVNVYEAGHFHGPHSHPGTLLAAIYAVSLPEDVKAPEGSVAFQDPRREAANHLAPLKFTGEGADAFCHLREGDLLIFPGWLTHYVVPHRSSSKRVTISANIGLDVQEIRDGP